jgi:hypothetical protein
MQNKNISMIIDSNFERLLLERFDVLFDYFENMSVLSFPYYEGEAQLQIPIINSPCLVNAKIYLLGILKDLKSSLENLKTGTYEHRILWYITFLRGSYSQLSSLLYLLIKTLKKGFDSEEWMNTFKTQTE